MVCLLKKEEGKGKSSNSFSILNLFNPMLSSSPQRPRFQCKVLMNPFLASVSPFATAVNYCSSNTTVACSVSENGRSVERCLGMDYICNGHSDCARMLDDEYGCTHGGKLGIFPLTRINTHCLHSDSIKHTNLLSN